MITHELKQGSRDWLEHRKFYWNASDAPAMMGVSPHKSRDQLIRELATGLSPEIGTATQARFAEGHRFETLARPLAEKIIGEDLYPVTGSEGKYSASFDGLNMSQSVNFEHKRLNDNIRTCSSVDDLGICYKIQMEHQHLVSGCEKTLFMATLWDESDSLIEKKEFWYVSDLNLRQQIIDGWAQLEKDVAAYVPHETSEPPKAAAIMALPALAIAIKGEVTLSNLPEFKEAATAYIAQINTTLVTDDDFSNAEAAAKFCKEAEDNIELTKKSAIAQTASIDELMRTLDFIKGQLRDKRLIIDKLVTSEKENRKLAIIQNIQHEYLNHLNALYAETKPIEIVINKPDFAGAIKGKKTLSSMQSAVNDELARAKIEADAIARDIRGKLAWYNEIAADFKNLFADLQTIIYKPTEDFELAVTSRIEAQKKLEAERAAKAKQENDHPQNWDDVVVAGGVLDKVLSASLPRNVAMPEITGTELSIAANFKTRGQAMPSVDEIVLCVSSHFMVSPIEAHQWLIDSDFGQRVAA